MSVDENRMGLTNFTLVDRDQKTWWQRRSKLEKKLVVTVIITVILLAIVLSVLLFFIIKQAVAPEICTTPGCLQEASMMASRIDTGVDPCTDFLKFACGKSINQTYKQRPIKWIKQLENDDVERQLREIREEPITNNSHYLAKAQKHLFQACLNQTAIEEKNLVAFLKILEELNGWPVIDGYHWKEKMYNWTKMIHALRKRGYSHSMLLTVDTIIDTSTQQYILRIAPPQIEHIDNIDGYKQYMLDLAVIFGVDQNHAKDDVEKVMEFRQNLQKIVDQYKWQPENNTAEVAALKLRVEDFYNQASDVNWLEFVNTLANSPTNLSESDYVVFPKPGYMGDFLDLIYDTPKRIQANYIIWNVVQQTLPYLPKIIQNLERNLVEQTKKQLPTEDSLKFCKSILKQRFDRLQNTRYVPPVVIAKIRTVFGTVKAQIETLLIRNTWIDTISAQNVKKILTNTKEIIGLPADYIDKEVFDIFKVDVDGTILSGSFLEMILNRKKSEVDKMYHRNQMTAEKAKTEIYDADLDIKITYLPQHNVILIPSAALQNILFDEKGPMYLNYGSLGATIAYELSSSFSQYGNILTNKSRNALRAKIECIMHGADDNIKTKLSSVLKFEELAGDYGGLRASYAAYQQWARDNGKEEPHLTKIDYIPNQLFWIEYVKQDCYQLSGEKTEFRTTASLRNNPDFSKDFNCPENSKMNPSKKCEMF